MKNHPSSQQALRKVNLEIYLDQVENVDEQILEQFSRIPNVGLEIGKLNSILCWAEIRKLLNVKQ